jgi:hypothetical protein
VTHVLKKWMQATGPERSGKASLFFSALLLCTAARSATASAEMSVDVQSFWEELGQSRDLHSSDPVEAKARFSESELKDESVSTIPANSRESHGVAATSTVLTVFPARQLNPVKKARVSGTTLRSIQPPVVADTSHPMEDLHFPTGVPSREVLRVSETFQGMIHESLRSAVVPYSSRYLGSLTRKAPVLSAMFSGTENPWWDDDSEADDGYSIGEALEESGQSSAMLNPQKTYTVVNGQIHAVTPTQVSTPASAMSGAALAASSTNGTSSAQGAQSGAPLPSSPSELNLPQDEVKKGLSQIFNTSRSAAVSGTGSVDERVSVQGRVSLPAGFAKDRVVLRMAGTAFQFQTDAAGSFELRDVPRGTRFELIVWHLDGSLTRRLIPVTASGREKLIEISLEKTSQVDSVASAFGLIQKMNQAGFCGRVEAESAARLIGGTLSVHSGRKEFQPHYFSSAGLPSASTTELSEDGRFCVFNVDEPLVDVKVSLINGIRRQFSVHLEPSVFEHDLAFDVSEALYRRMTLLEPLDTQQILELSSQGVQPDFGDQRLRDWINGNDVPVWTVVSRFAFQSDNAYSPVRPKAEDLQFFPGGQEFVELRVSPDFFGASVSRVIVSRDQLFTSGMLQQLASLKTKIFQDKEESFSVAALDADAWDDIAAKYVQVPRLQPQTTGGVFVSIDPSGLGRAKDDLVVTLRDTWTGKDVCSLVRLESAREIRSARNFRAVCGTTPGQYALIIESKEGVLLWSDVVRVRAGDVQTVTVFDPKF